METTGVIARPRVPAQLVLRSGVGVTAEVPSLEGGLRFHARVAAGEDLGDPPEDVVEPQAVPDFVDHGVRVARDSVEGGIQHDATCKGRREQHLGLPCAPQDSRRKGREHIPKGRSSGSSLDPLCTDSFLQNRTHFLHGKVSSHP